MNLFEILNERYVLPPKPKLFESFAGIGCQRMAFDRLGIDYESVGISEIDKYAVISYASVHCGLGEEIGKLQKEIKREILEKAKENGAKKKPKRLKKKVSKLSDKEKYAIANRLSKNYGDITKINGYQLPTIDVFTYSFPCTDLSKAGKQKGLNATRSGLVYEVLRILQELKDLHNLPSVLIMENVVDLVQTKFIREFNEIQLELEGLGYSNYIETMNAKGFGVAQNRDRIFMVSILGDYYYEFPKPIKLEKRLKDYLESEVDEKYILSKDLLLHIKKTGVDHGNYVEYERYKGEFESLCRIWKDLSPTLHTKCNEIKIFDGEVIRNMMPIETWRLMGIDDECFHRAEKVCSNSQLYKQAGNGIVVDVFAAIIKNFERNV